MLYTVLHLVPTKDNRMQGAVNSLTLAYNKNDQIKNGKQDAINSLTLTPNER